MLGFSQTEAIRIAILRRLRNARPDHWQSVAVSRRLIDGQVQVLICGAGKAPDQSDRREVAM